MSPTNRDHPRDTNPLTRRSRQDRRLPGIFRDWFPPEVRTLGVTPVKMKASSL